MKKILISAFAPFGGMELNSSSLVMNSLKTFHPGLKVIKVLLPVLYEEAFNILKAAVEDYKPDFVICMGQAGGRTKISIERIAVNINNASLPDNRGVIKTDELINSKSSNAYFTTIPYKRMISAGNEHTAVSYSAGTYICNDVFYRMLDYSELAHMHIKWGFLHLPFTEHFGKMPYINLETQVETIEAMISVMGENDE